MRGRRRRPRTAPGGCCAATRSAPCSRRTSSRADCGRRDVSPARSSRRRCSAGSPRRRGPPYVRDPHRLQVDRSRAAASPSATRRPSATASTRQRSATRTASRAALLVAELAAGAQGRGPRADRPARRPRSRARAARHRPAVGARRRPGADRRSDGPAARRSAQHSRWTSRGGRRGPVAGCRWAAAHRRTALSIVGVGLGSWYVPPGPSRSSRPTSRSSSPSSTPTSTPPIDARRLISGPSGTTCLAPWCSDLKSQLGPADGSRVAGDSLGIRRLTRGKHMTFPSGQPAPPGYYPDPAGSGLLRWWHGSAWTDDLAQPAPPMAPFGSVSFDSSAPAYSTFGTSVVPPNASASPRRSPLVMVISAVLVLCVGFAAYAVKQSRRMTPKGASRSESPLDQPSRAARPGHRWSRRGKQMPSCRSTGPSTSRRWSVGTPRHFATRHRRHGCVRAQRGLLRLHGHQQDRSSAAEHQLLRPAADHVPSVLRRDVADLVVLDRGPGVHEEVGPASRGW